jgi:hypothetical protein
MIAYAACHRSLPAHGHPSIMLFREELIERAKEQIILGKKRKGHTPRKLWKKMKTATRIEAIISHCKKEHRMGHNRLSGILDDSLNALMSAAAKILSYQWMKRSSMRLVLPR